jgi:hypothetical protein
LGGPWIFDQTRHQEVAGTPDLCYDFNADGYPDLVSTGYGSWYKGGPGPLFYVDTVPLFNFEYPREFVTHTAIGVADYDSDGYRDLLMTFSSQSHHWIGLYRGGPSWKDTIKLSGLLDLKSYRRGYGQLDPFSTKVVGNFDNSGRASILLLYKDTIEHKNTGEIGWLQNKLPLEVDTLVWLASYAAPQSIPEHLLAMDITGDGIDDLLVSDKQRIYIFKGGSDFGTYPLTPENAFYTIRSPRNLDFANYGFLTDFGIRMANAGDLSGAGIPYLLVGDESDILAGSRSVGFVYAGGAALDSLYDGTYMFAGNSVGRPTLDTLNALDQTGRTAGLMLVGPEYEGGYNRRLLLYRGLDKLPHRTNPAMVKYVEQLRPKSVSVSPTIANSFVTCRWNSQSYLTAEISVRDLLGRTLVTRHEAIHPGENTVYFDISTLAVGTYFLQTSGVRDRIVSSQRTKFVVRR